MAGTLSYTEANVRIYDASGRWMQELSLKLEEGYGLQKLDLRNYASGIYFLQIESACWQSVEKLVVIQH